MSKHELTDLQMYNSLKKNFDELRDLVTCKICVKLLYEPYVTSCGHTYCYSVSDSTMAVMNVFGC